MITLYCNCFKDKLNRKVEYNQKNLMLGACNYDPEMKEDLRNKNFLFDDTGDNISHLNKWFGQLTGNYWVWKNTNDEIVGTNTYRIFWGDYFLKNTFKKNVLYAPIIKELDRDVYDHYSYCHGEINLKFLYYLSEKNLIPIKPNMIENLKRQRFLYPFNLFISEKKIFDELCSLLFNDIIFVFYEHYKDHFLNYENQYNQSRILDFLSERILHMIYTNIDSFFTGVNIEPILIPHSC